MLRLLLQGTRKEKSSLFAMKSPLYLRSSKGSFHPVFAEWWEELGHLQTKIQKSEQDHERLEELQENIDREHKRLANKQVLLTVQAIRRGMEVSLMDPPLSLSCQDYIA